MDSLNAVLYARISSDRPSSESEDEWIKEQGVNRQLDDLRKLAARNNDRIVAEVKDNNESAFRRRKPRPGYRRVVEMVKAGEVNAIYAWHPDRLYRSLRDLEELVELIEAHDLVVRTEKAGEIDLATPTGRMIARVVGSMSRYESEHGAERRARKHASLAEQGKPSGGGRRPFGYAEDRVTVVADEADALRAAAEAVLAGSTLAQAARDFSAALERPVRPNILRNLLVGPRVAGYRQHIPSADRARGVTEAKLTPAVWPAILDDATWRKLRAILLDPRRRNTRPARTYLLSGLLHCGLCRSPLAGGNGSYKCSASNGGCAKLSVSMRAADKWVTAWARAEADDEAVAARLTALSEAPPAAATDKLSTEQVSGRRATLATLFACGDINADEWRTARDHLDTLAGQASEADADRTRLAEAARRALSVVAAWDGATVADRRAAVRALLGANRLVVAPRGKRNGNAFDPDRISITP